MEQGNLERIRQMEAKAAAAAAGYGELPRVESLVMQHGNRMVELRARMADWLRLQMQELEMSAVSATLLLLGDASAALTDAAARLRGAASIIDYAVVTSASTRSSNIDKIGRDATRIGDVLAAVGYVSGGQAHLLLCSARVRVVLRCFQEVDNLGVAGAEQLAVIARGEFGEAQKSLAAAVAELMKATKLTAAVYNLPI